jgi:2'-5' RNA ligase
VSMAAADLAAQSAPAEPINGEGRWTGLATMANRPTIDTGETRNMVPGALRWNGEIQMLTWSPTGEEGHEGGMPVGGIDDVRWEGDNLMVAGFFDASETAQELRRQSLNGMPWKLSINAPGAGSYTVDFGADGSVVETLTDGIFTGALVCAGPASDLTWFKAEPEVAELAIVDLATGEVMPMMASADYPIKPPLVPPAKWFAAPSLDGPTPLTITDEGQIFGHVGDGCHLSQRGCVHIRDATQSRDFRRFNRGQVVVEGGRVNAGQITLVGGHPSGPAGGMLSAAAAEAHYNDTRSAVADVTVGWDDINDLPYFAGALRSDVTPEQIRALTAAGISGDWRLIPGSGDPARQLIALPAVNAPAFGIPRSLVASAYVVDGEVQTLIMGPIVAATPPQAGNAQAAADGGVMIAVFPDPAVAKTLALPTGEPPESLHVTLSYFGSLGTEIDQAGVDTIMQVVTDFASANPTLSGQISGLGRFFAAGRWDVGDQQENVQPFIALVDVPDLSDLQADLDDALEAAGLAPMENHDFCPHVTLAWVGPSDPNPLDTLTPVDVTFSQLSVVVGGQRTDYPLGPSTLEASAAPMLKLALEAIDHRMGGVAQEVLIRQLQRLDEVMS